MPDGKDYISKTYQALKENLDGFDKTEQEYRKLIAADSNYRKRVYSALKDNLDGFSRSEDDFYVQLGVKKKDGGGALPNGATGTSEVETPGNQRLREVTDYLRTIKQPAVQDNIQLPVAVKQAPDVLRKDIAKQQQNNEFQKMKQSAEKKKSPLPAPLTPNRSGVAVSAALSAKYGADWKNKATQKEKDEYAAAEQFQLEDTRRYYEKMGGETVSAPTPQQLQEQKLQQESDEFYNSALGQLYWNVLKPVGGTGVKILGGTVSTAIRGAGDIIGADEITDGIADYISSATNPDEWYKDRVTRITPSQLKGGLFNDGKLNTAQMMPKLAETLTTMFAITQGGGGNAGLFTRSFLVQQEDYRREGEAAGLSGGDLDAYAYGGAFLTSALEPLSPNKIIGGDVKKKAGKVFFEAIESGFSREVAFKKAAKTLVKESGLENVQEFGQGIVDKAQRYFTDKMQGKPVFNDDLSWEGVKDEVYETLFLTTGATMLLTTPKVMRDAKPSNLEKSSWYNAALNPDKFMAYINKRVAAKELTVEDAQKINENFAKYKGAVEQAQKLGFSADQTVDIAFDIYRGQDVTNELKQISNNPILKESVGEPLKEEKEVITENIKRIGMGVPEVGTEITGVELSTIIENIGDKGGDVTGLQEQVKDNKYRVEEVNVKELYNNDAAFRLYVENYDRKKKNDNGLLVPAIMSVDGKMIDGKSRLAQQYINGETTVQVFKELKQPVVDNSQQPQGEVVENKQQVEYVDAFHSTFEDFNEFKDGVTYFSKDENYSKEISKLTNWKALNNIETRPQRTIKAKIRLDRVYDLPQGQELNSNLVNSLIKQEGFTDKYDVIRGIDLYSDNKEVYAVINKSAIEQSPSGIKPTENAETIPEQVQNDNTQPTPATNQPVQPATAATPQQEPESAVPQSADAVGQGDAVATAPVSEPVKTKPARIETPQLTERQTTINNLLDRIKNYGKMDKRDKAAMAKEANSIQTEADAIGYKFDSKSNALLNEIGEKQQKRNALTNKTIAEGFDRAAYSDQTNAAIDQITENPAMVKELAVKGVDGRRMDDKQINNAIKSIKSGKVDFGAKQLFDYVEDALEKGGIEIEDKLQGKRELIPFEEYFAAKQQTIEEVNALLNNDAFELAEVEPIFEEVFINEQEIIDNGEADNTTTELSEQQPSDEGQTGKPASTEPTKPVAEPVQQDRTAEDGEEVDGEEVEKPKREKALLNRAYEGDNPESIKDKIAEYGLDYEQQSYEDARAAARKIINDIGIENAVEAVRRGMVKDAEAAFIWAEAVDMVGEQIATAKTDEEIEALEKLEASLLNEFDLQARGAGRFISALRDIYSTANFSFKLDVRIADYERSNGGNPIPPEVLEKYEKLDAEFQELQSKLAAAEQRAIDAEQKLAMDNIAESVSREAQDKAPVKTSKEKAKKIADKLRQGKTQRPGLFMSTTPAGLVWDAAIEAAATTIEVSGVVADAINAGITKLKESDWYKNLTGKQQQQAEQQFTDYVNNNLNEIEEEETKASVRFTKEGKLIIPHKLIRDYVKSGIKDIGDLVKALKKDFADVLEDVNDRVIRDAITKYGKTINLNKEEVETQIRKMKRIGRDLSKLEDINKGKRPVRSGLQRDELTPEERSLQKQVRELLKTLPPDAETQSQQLKTALDAIKTRLRNQIADFKKAIDEKKELVKSKGNTKYDAEAKALEEERNGLKELYEEVFGKEMTDEERADKIADTTERATKKILDKIAKNDLDYKKKNDVTSEKLEAARAALKEAKAKLDELRELSGVANERRLDAAKKRVENQIKEMERRLKEKDFSKKEKRQLTEDNELIRLKAEKQRIHEEYEKERYKAELKQRSLGQKIADGAIEVWNLSRVFMATGELSFIGIQLGMYSINNPRAAAKAFSKMIMHFASEKRFNEWERHIKAQPYYAVLKASKLALSEYDSKLTAREEIGVSGWANHLWDFVMLPIKPVSNKAYEFIKTLNPLKAFERAGVAYSNHMRLQRFLQGMDKLQMEGKTFQQNPLDYKRMADAINTLTGRASLGKAENSAKLLSILFFSPRNWASMIKQFPPIFFTRQMYKWRSTDGGISVAQKMALTDYIKYMTITGGAILGIAAAFNDDDEEDINVSFDPTSSDFLKVKTGNTRIDAFGGRTQMIVFSLRMILDEKTNTSGKTTRLGSGLFTPTRFDLMEDMVFNKLAPTAGKIREYLDTRTKEGSGDSYTRINKYSGEEYSIAESATEGLQPIFWKTLREIHKDQPTEVAAFLDVLAAIGVNIQVYEAKKKKAANNTGRVTRETMK